MLRGLPEPFDQNVLDLDRHHRRGDARQPGGERAVAGAYLEDRRIRGQHRFNDDTIGYPVIDQQVLAAKTVGAELPAGLRAGGAPTGRVASAGHVRSGLRRRPRG